MKKVKKPKEFKEKSIHKFEEAEKWKKIHRDKKRDKR
jgi:hypothetical protein